MSLLPWPGQPLSSLRAHTDGHLGRCTVLLFKPVLVKSLEEQNNLRPHLPFVRISVMEHFVTSQITTLSPPLSRNSFRATETLAKLQL
jgi:hypothetical protein